MANEEHDCYDSGFGLRWGVKFLYAAVGIAGLAMIARLGPIDAGRTIYNQLTGDMPVLKRELVNYCEEGIKRKHGGKHGENDIESILIKELDLRNVNISKASPDDVSIEVLWATAEKYPKSPLDYWVWTDSERLAPDVKKVNDWVSSYFPEKSINKDKQ